MTTVKLCNDRLAFGTQNVSQSHRRHHKRSLKYCVKNWDSKIHRKQSEKSSTSKDNSNSSKTNVEFKTFNATKVIAYSKFSAVKINDGFTVHLRPSKPLAKLVSWGVSDHLNCHRMELKCIEEKN